MTRKIELTAAQVELARHALGLPNKRRKSFRNRFVAGPDHADYEAWTAMVGMGAAKRFDGRALPYGGCDLFMLTEKGARGALKRGEMLCPEDFPKPDPLAFTGSAGGMVERDRGAE